MKKYQCHKIVKAEPMTREQFYQLGSSDGLEEFKTEGYKVVYADGYIGWSPKKVFEEGYTLIED